MSCQYPCKWNCAVLLSDHHRKLSSLDVVADIQGSTEKTAFADVTLGMYRQRGQASARLAIIGRDVRERTLALQMDCSSFSRVVQSAALKVGAAPWLR